MGGLAVAGSPEIIWLMKKKFFYGVLVSALTVHLVLGASLFLTYAETSQEDDVYRSLELFTGVLEKVRTEYVDGDHLTYQELIEGALNGMLRTLDPHSEFLDQTRFEDLKNDTEGLFGGVGLVISVRDNALTVVAPMEDSPAFRAGIKSGDRIIRIEGVSTDQFGLPEAVKRLRGEPGSPVSMTLFRTSTGEEREVTLVRAIIKVNTVKDLNGGREFPVSDEHIGYLRLTQFGEQTSAELDEALRQLESRGMTGLILDLRDNPGGLLDQAAEVCKRFLPERRQLIVSTEGRRARDRTEYSTSRPGRYSHLPMVVLVNGGSASASEIVAGCLQDTGRAVLVGERSFGKGSVQKILPLKGGAALRLTTAKYYTPGRRVIHGNGIEPDLAVPFTMDQQVALARFLQGHEDALPEDRMRLASVPDPQLQTAVNVLKGAELLASRRTEARHASRD